jgi:hypothetical protein
MADERESEKPKRSEKAIRQARLGPCRFIQIAVLKRELRKPWVIEQADGAEPPWVGQADASTPEGKDFRSDVRMSAFWQREARRPPRAPKKP